jgi:tellurite resistance protein TerC
MITPEILFFVGFALFIITILMVDLLFVGRHSHVLSVKESAIWTSIWVGCALAFYFVIRFYGDRLHGLFSMEDIQRAQQLYAPHLVLPDSFQEALDAYRSNMATEYLTGYFMEYTLSIDNVFVIMMILTGFAVETRQYKKVLFWGILGAIILRFIFIFVGSALIQRFEWILYIFGAFLLYTGVKMFLERNKEEAIEIHEHWLVKYLGRHFRITPQFEGGKFFVRRERKNWITPLFVVLILIEFTDLIFALDSIPAIFSITRDPYIVFFSNIFAIIGLRSLFFFLVKLVQYFRFLKVGIAFLLAFIGVKLMAAKFLHAIHYQSVYSLYIILGVLFLSILFSVLIKEKKDAPAT